MKTTIKVMAAALIAAGVAFFQGCCSSCGKTCKDEAKTCCAAPEAKCPEKCCDQCKCAPGQCMDCPESCAKQCKCAAKLRNCPFGNWALWLPFPSMNAGHLILAKDEAGNPTAKLLWRWASPFDIKGDDLKISEGGFTLYFHRNVPKGKENDKSAWRVSVVRAKIKGRKAQCEFSVEDGEGKVVEQPKKFRGRRNPPIGPAPDLAKIKFGKPIDLLAGSIDDFELMGGDHSGMINGWTLKDGVLSNRITRDANGKSLHKNGNLRTKRADFFDFNLKYDVRVLPGCNSGMYLRGIYEIQVIDSYGKPLDCHNMGAYYGRVTPTAAAEKPANEWQSVDVTLYKRHLTVILNGVKIIDNVPVTGITGGAMSPDEFSKGPLYIQGDHSDADFRNLVLTPIVK